MRVVGGGVSCRARLDIPCVVFSDSRAALLRCGLRLELLSAHLQRALRPTHRICPSLPLPQRTFSRRCASPTAASTANMPMYVDTAFSRLRQRLGQRRQKWAGSDKGSVKAGLRATNTGVRQTLCDSPGTFNELPRAGYIWLWPCPRLALNLPMAPDGMPHLVPQHKAE